MVPMGKWHNISDIWCDWIRSNTYDNSTWFISLSLYIYIYLYISVIWCDTNNYWYEKWYQLDILPGGLFIEPAFSTFAVFVIDFIPQITVVLHLSQSSISLKSMYARTFHWICKKPQRHSLFFCAKCPSQFLQWAWRGFCGKCFPISTAKREHTSKSCHWARLT